MTANPRKLSKLNAKSNKERTRSGTSYTHEDKRRKNQVQVETQQPTDFDIAMDFRCYRAGTELAVKLLEQIATGGTLPLQGKKE